MKSSEIFKFTIPKKILKLVNFLVQKNKSYHKMRYSDIIYNRKLSDGKITKNSKLPYIYETSISIRIPSLIEQSNSKFIRTMTRRCPKTDLLMDERVGEWQRRYKIKEYRTVQLTSSLSKGFTKPDLFNQIYDDMKSNKTKMFFTCEPEFESEFEKKPEVELFDEIEIIDVGIDYEIDEDNKYLNQIIKVRVSIHYNEQTKTK